MKKAECANLQQNTFLKRWESASPVQLALHAVSRALFLEIAKISFARDWVGVSDIYEVSPIISTPSCLWQKKSSSSLLTLLNLFSLLPFTCSGERSQRYTGSLLEVLEHLHIIDQYRSPSRSGQNPWGFLLNDAFLLHPPPSYLLPAQLITASAAKSVYTSESFCVTSSIWHRLEIRWTQFSLYKQSNWVRHNNIHRVYYH